MIVVAKGPNIKKRTKAALKAFKPKIKNKTILIKPNLVEPLAKDSGAVTRPELIAGIIEYFQESEKKKKKIIIGEGAGIRDTFKCFKIAGYLDLEKKYDIELIDLNQDKFIPIKGQYWNFQIHELAKKAAIISAPILKEHETFEITLSCKNLMGFLKPQKILSTKAYMHPLNNKKIWTQRMIDLVKVCWPVLNVMDATTGMCREHLYGKCKRFNLTIVGENPIEFDYYTANLMAHKEVFYLRALREAGLGKLPSPKNIKQISVK